MCPAPNHRGDLDTRVPQVMVAAAGEGAAGRRRRLGAVDSSQISLVPANLAHVLERVARAAAAAGRSCQDVDVMLAVKTQPVDVVLAGLEAMARARPGRPVLLGQNRVQEMAGTGPALAAPDLPAHEMRLIGPLQSNKVNHTLAWATGVDSVDSLRLAQRLSAACDRQGRDLDVRVEVNVSGEASKAGVAPAAYFQAFVDEWDKQGSTHKKTVSMANRLLLGKD